MAGYCAQCGNRLEDGEKFCGNCGAAAPAQQQAQPMQQTQQLPQQPYPAFVCAGNGPVRQGIPAPGFSDRVNDPEILAAVKKNRKAGGFFALFFVPLPLVGFAIYSLVSGNMEMKDALLYGGILSAVFLVFTLIGALRGRASGEYEAVVTAQDSRTRYRTKGDDSQQYTEYITTVTTTDGKQKKIVEYGRIWAYRYLHVGDRFRYHPQFAFPYERYDKAQGEGLYCVSCQTLNPIEADRCSRCHIPLLK